MHRYFKYISCFFLALTGLTANGQFSDDFSDGDFTNNPTWSTSSPFVVNASQQLQLVDVAASQSSIYTSFSSQTLNDKEWRFQINQTFAGSDANQSRIYLIANNAPTAYSGSGSAGVQGYFLKFGEGGSNDAITLYRDDAVGNPTALATGIAGAISSSFNTSIRVVRSNSGEWTIYSDFTNSANYTLQATVTDNTYSSGTHFGIICKYTVSNADNFFFDNFYFGDVIVDMVAPELVSAAILDGTSVLLTFSESMSEGSLLPLSHYTVSANSAINAELTSSTVVTVTFSNTFPEDVTFSITVSGLEDVSGNEMITATEDLFYSIPDVPFFRSVVFNEVLADPSPIVGLGEFEFVELHNPTFSTFDLAGWQFINTTTAKTLPTYLLQPGEFVILCNSDSASVYPNSIGIASFSALTNDGDSLTLLDNNGNIIDLLVYDIDWYSTSEKAEGGWSLEQKNPSFPCISSSNWAESIHPTGGTPSGNNSILDVSPDLTTPTVSSILVANSTTLLISFSETMSSGSIDDLVLAFEPGQTITSTAWSNNGYTQITVTLTDALTIGNTYSVTISGVSDCSGNALNDTTLDFALGYAPEEFDIIINEIFADESPVIQGPEAEFIELYNRSNKLIDLNGCYINNGQFEQQTLIAPEGYLIVADASQAVAFAGYTNVAFQESFPALTNTGMLLQFKNNAEIILDEVDYSDDWYRDPARSDGGYSIELINPNDPCSTGDNWRACVDARGVTAGEVNSVLDLSPDTTTPEIIAIYSQPVQAITITFSEPLDPNTIDGIQWSVDGSAMTPANAFFANTNGDAIVIPFIGMVEGVTYTFILSNIFDCWGNEATGLNGKTAAPVAPEMGDLIINEVLFNPYSEGEDFVELYNNGSLPISLANVYIGNQVDGVAANLVEITTDNIILFPGEYLVVSEDIQTIPTLYPGTRTDRLLEMSSMPAYNNSEGDVYIVLPNFQTADELHYTEDMHFPLLDDVDGVSLERIDPNRDSDDNSNWHSAAENVGFATPGYLNSQAQDALSGENTFNQTNELFSPDNDGYQDVSTLTWNLDQPGFIGNITIFDSAGRKVRNLMSNELLGAEGSISWDGTTDEGILCQMGIYVIYIELFNAEGDVSKYKKTCVLAHKLN